MIIGLTGLKQSGKDTVGAYLMKEHGFQRISFAEPGKKLSELALNIPHWEAEQFKNADDVFVAIGYKNALADPKVVEFMNANMPPEFEDQQVESTYPANMWSPISEYTYREWLQRLLNEAAKTVFGDDVWAKLALPVDGFYTGRKIVVTDLRFKVEVPFIRAQGGKIVRLIRDSVAVPANHVSEIELQEIEPDFVLYNNDSIQNLFSSVEAMLTQLGDMDNAA